MIASSELYLFVAAALVCCVVPGPAVLFIIARSVEFGPKAGLVSSLGMTLGALVHVFLTVFGLSAIMATSAVVFGIVKFAGAAYLIFLGVSKLLEKTVRPHVEQTHDRDLTRIFWQAVVVQVFNPKTGLFFLSFLPQFVNASAGSVSIQLFTLGLLFVAMVLVTDSVYSVFAGLLRRAVTPSARTLTRRKWAIGATYIALGVTAGLSGSKHK